MVRQLPLCLVVGALSACSGGSGGTPTPLAFATAQDAVRQVCTSPSSHRGIVTAVRALHWPLLRQGDIPEQVVGNGMVSWSDVALSPGRDMMVAAGRAGGTSFCRVYVRQAQSSPVQQILERTAVLGAPLGAPDFRQSIDGSDVTGWHRRVGREWRAVHLSIAEPPPAQQSAMPVVIEVTRSAT